MKNEIYDYEKRLERYRRIIAGFGHNGEVALRFLDHLLSLGLFIARVSGVAGHLPALLQAIGFRLGDATRRDVERVVAWINMNLSRSPSIGREPSTIRRRLIQFAKYGSCDGNMPIPPEDSWIKLNYSGGGTQETPVNLCLNLTPTPLM